MNGTVEQGPSADELLTVRLRQQELVASFGMFALRSNDIEGVLQQACEIAARGLDTQFAKLLELSADGQGLLVRNGVGWRDGVVGQVVLGVEAASPAGFALQARLPVLSNHLTEQERFRTPALLAEHGIRSAINVIVERDRAASMPFGVLAVDSSGRDQFSTPDVAFMQSLANVLSAAIVRQQHEAARERLLREKDVLMQEVHHRVKNNLQLVQTMLTLQARNLADGTERSGLRSAAARIMSIAAVHRRLYEAGALELVEFGPYLLGLVADLVDSFGGADAARPVMLDAEAMQLPPEHVTSVGLIVVELVTNAMKYGAGFIGVRVLRTGSGIDVVVEDEGDGIPPGMDMGFGGSLGLRLVAALARSADPIAISRHAGGSRVAVRVAFAPLAPSSEPNRLEALPAAS